MKRILLVVFLIAIASVQLFSLARILHLSRQVEQSQNEIRAMRDALGNHVVWYHSGYDYDD